MGKHGVVTASDLNVRNTADGGWGEAWLAKEGRTGRDTVHAGTLVSNQSG